MSTAKGSLIGLILTVAHVGFYRFHKRVLQGYMSWRQNYLFVVMVEFSCRVPRIVLHIMHKNMENEHETVILLRFVGLILEIPPKV